ncbi:patched domain-containing protein 3-like [Hypomesus transpacificus]|uniref:patched domain-containing protein 3-like n=1 Tax=Hypomesus transpacificus TaxID=137520 RepID=UPI001F07FC56|nr:patched domain-containing protein 3-like [Hypomesus transpacificus]
MPVNMAGCRTDCVEKPFSIGYKNFGRFVGLHPWWFFLGPLILSTALGSGFYFLEDREANDIEDQFTPTNGPAKLERRFVQENFPLNNSVFSNQRLYTDGIYASFIAVSKAPHIFTDAAIQEILSLDKKVKEINISNGHEQLTFEALCARKYNKCIPNKILDIVNHYGSKIEETELTFPFFRFGFTHIFLGYSVGGLSLRSSVIKSAKAIRLLYFLKEGNRSTTDLWLNEFLRVFPSNVSLKFIKVTHSTSLSRQVEFEANTKDVIPLFSITYVIAIAFSILSCLRFDCVRNKVWVATFGVFSAGLAVLSAFGMMLHIGVPFVMTVANSPFLILGIGVDDMFILISCWQQTNVHDRVEDRLADTYKEAAISITITTLTDVLAFYIGLMTPFRSVQSFCLYTSTSILFCYIYSITFFGAFLVLNGRRENSNKHWLTCKEVPGDCPIGRSKWYSLCCVGGAYDRQTGSEEVQPMNHFFKKYYGPFLTRSGTKVCVILLYAVYLIISVYGCFQIQEGIDLRNLAADDSGSSSKVSTQEKTAAENQDTGNCRPPQKRGKPIEQDKTIYDNCSFTPDNHQICETRSCPSMWTLNVNIPQTQSGQMCMISTVPMFTVDTETYEVQMYAAGNSTELSVNWNQNTECVLMVNNQTILQESSIPKLICSNSESKCLNSLRCP